MSNNSYTFTLVNTNGSLSFTPSQIKVDQPSDFAIVPGTTGATFKEFAFEGVVGPLPFSSANVTPSQITFRDLYYLNGQTISGTFQFAVVVVYQGAEQTVQDASIVNTP